MKLSIELLAPAGNRDCLKAALLAGADAVYLGGKSFGARAFASNFCEDDLKWARLVTRARNKKLFITINTIIFDQEWPQLTKTIEFLEYLQPDAYIIQDFGVARYLKQIGSCIPRHLSTQAAWNGLGGADFIKDLGFKRVILPRELSLKEICEISKHAPFETEVFVHGAMCYSISGRCFWSVALGARSGNRGTCAQPCRKTYFLNKNKNGCFFSPKDLRLILRLEDLQNAGVKCIKIEGRMKSAYYVYQTVKSYRNALDGPLSPENGRDELSEVFSRPFHEGFFNGPPSHSWETGETPGHIGNQIGQVAIPRLPSGLTELELVKPIRAGDGLAWMNGLERQGAFITWVKALRQKPLRVLVRGLPPVPGETILYRTNVAEKSDWLCDWQPEWELFPIELFWSGYEDSFLAVETCFQGEKVRLLSRTTLSIGLGGGLEQGVLEKRFKFIGDKFQVTRQVMRALKPGLFLQPSELKSLKRALFHALSRISSKKFFSQPKIIKEEETILPSPLASIIFPKPPPRLSLRLWKNQAFRFHHQQPDHLIVPFDGEPQETDFYQSSLSYWIRPPTSRAELEILVKNLKKLDPQEFLCLSWEAFELSSRLPQHRFRLDFTFNIANMPAFNAINENNLAITMSREWPFENAPVNQQMVFAIPWNPLISLSQFKPSLPISTIFCNSHKDRFFLENLGQGVTGMFLDAQPLAPLFPDLPVRIDYAPLPGYDKVQDQENLEKFLAAIKRKLSIRKSPQIG